MNLRIQELSDKADLYARSDNSSMLFENYIRLYTEKFTELIVKECVESVDDIEELFFNTRIATVDFSEKNRFAAAETACQMAKQKIKRRFKVEE